MQFWTGSIERMRITSDGEVLVGGTTAITTDRPAITLQHSSFPVFNLFRSGTSIVGGGGSGTITSSGGISPFSSSGGGADPASAYSFSHLDAVTKAVAQAAQAAAAAAAASSSDREGHGDVHGEEEYSSDDDGQGGVTAAGVGAAALEAFKQGSSLFAGFSSSFKRDY
jgi:hypothetical protein